MDSNELVRRIAAARCLPEMEARAILNMMFQSIFAAAKDGEEISILGFGKFSVKSRPRDAEGQWIVSEPVVIHFTPYWPDTLPPALVPKLPAPGGPGGLSPAATR
ncbi:HU family DNA-binding protein [Sandaracinobacter sp. RS1-74]|uniref:HU family DNA-binding protein n=1 Tax=Sandaracinobacteroides sayramensis TaxID=2913411 RepID=UPI001EDA3B1B|nr:HU family DNA-binding protein [Sandaracinobacteroides sayramensis]MCG2841214.1 HU family DNA-binding protein [Sandaracinobacteroides sayramensis]